MEISSTIRLQDDEDTHREWDPRPHSTHSPNQTLGERSLKQGGSPLLPPAKLLEVYHIRGPRS